MADSSQLKTPRKTSARPSLRMVAAEAGYSLATTSLALRESSGIPEKTRKHIQGVAHRMGYRVDNKLSTLMQHLRTHQGGDHRETLAFLSTYSDYDSWKLFSQHDFYLGAVERAQELGYRVELFHLKEPGMTASRMSKRLRERGIRGILVGSFVKPKSVLRLEWEHFAAVTFGYSLVDPILHRITNDYYRAMLSVLDRLKSEGWKRIGLNISTDDDAKVFNLWRSAYLFFEETLPDTYVRIPINASPHGGRSLKKWIRENQPDVIVSAGCDFPWRYEKKYAQPAPDDISYVNMNLHHADERSRGIDQNSWYIGRTACNTLVTMLQRGEIGLPDKPQIIMTEGTWVDDYKAWVQAMKGRTLPQSMAYRLADPVVK